MEVGKQGDDILRTWVVSERESRRVSKRHEIQVGVSEEGELIFLDGRHRLAIAKLIGVKSIPVALVFCHTNMVRELSNMGFERVV